MRFPSACENEQSSASGQVSGRVESIGNPVAVCVSPSACVPAELGEPMVGSLAAVYVCAGQPDSQDFEMHDFVFLPFPESHVEESEGLHPGANAPTKVSDFMVPIFLGVDETDGQQQQQSGSSTLLVPHLRAAEQAGPTDVGGLCLGRS